MGSRTALLPIGMRLDEPTEGDEMTQHVPQSVTNRMPQPLTEHEKYLIGIWWMAVGRQALACPTRIDPARWEQMTYTEKLRINYGEWVHQMMLEGKL